MSLGWPNCLNVRCFPLRHTNLLVTDDYAADAMRPGNTPSPGDESAMVLVADLVNKMKSEMTEDEFKPRSARSLGTVTSSLGCRRRLKTEHLWPVEN
jgi:hypothetical protein